LLGFRDPGEIELNVTIEEGAVDITFAFAFTHQF
jgi:hypothetical protein